MIEATTSKLSWCILFLSILIDIISHTRAFPSYNIVIGIFAWFCAQLVKIQNVENEGNKKQDTILGTLSCFTTLSIISLILDVSFCFIWGRDIIDGDIGSVKFSFSIFILNMLPKAMVTL